MKENRFLGRFTEECLHLCDISPTLACAIIYGSWPSYRPNLDLQQSTSDSGNYQPNKDNLSEASLQQPTFNGENYLRYSEIARKEVIVALIKCGSKQVFVDVMIGLIETPDFFEELDLWKDWGVDANFINTELDEYVSRKVYQDTWLNVKLFADILNYIGKELSEQEADDWMHAIQNKHGITSQILLTFTESINQHVV